MADQKLLDDQDKLTAPKESGGKPDTNVAATQKNPKEKFSIKADSDNSSVPNDNHSKDFSTQSKEDVENKVDKLISSENQDNNSDNDTKAANPLDMNPDVNKIEENEEVGSNTSGHTRCCIFKKCFLGSKHPALCVAVQVTVILIVASAIIFFILNGISKSQLSPENEAPMAIPPAPKVPAPSTQRETAIDDTDLDKVEDITDSLDDDFDEFELEDL